MPLIINNIRGELDSADNKVISRGLKKAGILAEDVKTSGIYKSSLDARKRQDIHFVHSVFAELSDKEREKSIKHPDVKYIDDSPLNPILGKESKKGRIVIAGFGPAGMFCGLILAENGYRPLILERGQDCDNRVKAVKHYWAGGELDTESNVQFGEGGAGTFSDGKLTTRINDPLCRYVLKRFVDFGAPKEILVKAKPHMGTDNLRDIVKNMRKGILKAGGEIIFGARLDDIVLSDSKVKECVFGDSRVETAALVAAIGHSARDTFEMFAKRGIFMEPKPFSVGVRIEHRQRAVNESLYGKYADNPLLPVGEYQLSHRNSKGRGVYTFCMCPGGHVVPAASEENTIVTNGMSEYARDGENANAAIAVSVFPTDFGGGVLDGVKFAREIEKKAYALTGPKAAPATTVGGFLKGQPNLLSDLSPTYDRGVKACDFKRLFPGFVTDMLAEGLLAFSKKMNCFKDESAIMTGPETRTSSPVRISRSEDKTSLSAENFYPCGEGAGYAGGIMSAAVDGIKTALEIMKKISPP